MIDIHCHILPDIDDGPRTFEESIAMATMAAEDGIAAIVATPHLNEKLYDPVEISRRVSYLKHQLRVKAIPVSILQGADVSVVFKPHQVHGFTINDTNYILVEFPHTHLPKHAAEILHQFVAEGLRPIITHPERNPGISANPPLLKEIMGTNQYVQITAGSLTGEFGRDAKHCAEYLVKAGLVDVIATDAHSTTFRRPRLHAGMEAAAKLVGFEQARNMVFRNPVKIISGLDL